MDRLPKALEEKLHAREAQSALRSLPSSNGLIDFSSNDYLGFAQSRVIFKAAYQLLSDRNIMGNGATGSRLISGNHSLYPETERLIAQFHESPGALVFNSGYDANVGFFGCVPQRNDLILFDTYCHASIRDGIRLSPAKAYKFAHNDLEALETHIQKHQKSATEIYIVTESVFSMDGDSPHLEQLAAVATKYHCLLVIDEAHALGVFGEDGTGLLQQLDLQDQVFARIMTFGKGLGCHGAAILGSSQLMEYLVNFARSFIYTTGLPPHSLATILMAYRQLGESEVSRERLKDNILHFSQEINRQGLKPIFVRGKSAIQSAIIPGNEKVRNIALQLREKGFDVRAILSPTVPEGQERLRICLHSYNSNTEISALVKALTDVLH